jgi:FAD/FMN-containing dehydrogenase
LISLSDLRARVAGGVIGPDDEGYDEARSVASGAIDRRPAVIVCAADATDVELAIKLARETGLELAIRSGGHSAAGFGTSEGGIVLDLSAMNAIEIDAAAMTAWVGSGALAGDIAKATAAHGLALPLGDTASVGIGGLTLGGGVGYLVRKHGLTIDRLLGAELVTADGRTLLANAETHPDLYWAIRGGGGNFGVVTRFLFGLVPVPSVVGGMLILPATPDSLAAFMACAAAAPNELSAIINVMPAPPMPFVPPQHHGRPVIIAMLCYAGDTQPGVAAVAPFRAVTEPLVDMVRPTTYADLYPPEGPAVRMKTITRGLFRRTLDRAAAQTVVERLAASDAAMRVAQFRVLGGAMADVPADATAFAHRNSSIMVTLVTTYEDAGDRAVRASWAAEFADALDEGDPGVYVNFLDEADPERVRAAYPGRTWDRLLAVKRRYDPDNLFRSNQNIKPRAR